MAWRSRWPPVILVMAVFSALSLFLLTGEPRAPVVAKYSMGQKKGEAHSLYYYTRKHNRSVVFALRTTGRYHTQRLPVMLDTWISKASPGQVHVFTDNVSDEQLSHRLHTMGNELHSTKNCTKLQSGHTVRLCCKTGVEHVFFAEAANNYNWFCHIDDDVYINLPALYKGLGRYSPKREKVYFGKKTNHRLKNTSTLLEPDNPRRNDRFYLMYGGFYCLSHALMKATTQYFAGGLTMQRTCSDASESDDTTVGAVIGLLIPDVIVANSNLIHHHVKTTPLRDLPANDLYKQIAVSYGFGRRPVFQEEPNLINVPDAVFSLKEDPTRLKSYHCLLYPLDKMCTRRLVASSYS